MSALLVDWECNLKVNSKNKKNSHLLKKYYVSKLQVCDSSYLERVKSELQEDDTQMIKQVSRDNFVHSSIFEYHDSDKAFVNHML